MEKWKDLIKQRYKRLKEQGVPFFPDAVFRDAVVSLLVLGVLLFLAYKLGANLEMRADPTDTTYNPRPEWYFLFLFQALKFFPGKLEPVAAVLMPGVIVTILLLLPFIDRSPHRHPFDRPVASLAMIVALGLMLALTLAGARSPLINPHVEKDPKVIEGQLLFQSLRCAYCHTVNGRGGSVGPDLSTLGAQRDDTWIIRHFKDPKTESPNSVMPKFNLMDDEISSLIAYLRSLSGGAGPYSPRAKVLFTENCAVCHKIRGAGGDVGPDLSKVGTYRDKNYIAKYVDDPTQLNPEATMTGFKDLLKAAEIEDLARYLSAQK